MKSDPGPSNKQRGKLAAEELQRRGGNLNEKQLKSAADVLRYLKREDSLGYGMTDLQNGGKRIEIIDQGRKPDGPRTTDRKRYITELDADGNLIRAWKELVDAEGRLKHVKPMVDEPPQIKEQLRKEAGGKIPRPVGTQQ